MVNFWDAIFSKTRTNNTKQQQEVLTSKVQVWLWRIAIAVRQQTKGKTRTKNYSTTKKSEKEQHAGKETLQFDWFAPHFRHRFVTNCHYDGTIERHFGARANQSAIRNQPTWPAIQSFYYPCFNAGAFRKFRVIEGQNSRDQITNVRDQIAC